MNVETEQCMRHYLAVQVQKETRAKQTFGSHQQSSGDESSQDKGADEERIKLPTAN